MHLLHGLASGQVLQRLGKKGASAALSGTVPAPVSGTVTATISSKNKDLPGWSARAVGQARKGAFAARLAGIPAGGPYRLELRVSGTDEAVVVPAFFVGDVWILAGQSNMEGISNREGAARPHPLIQAFSMRRVWRQAAEPLHIIPESPDTSHAATQCTPQQGEILRRNTPKGVGPGLHFAHEMVKRSGSVPQALICTAHGGTSMTQWDPAKKGLKGGSLYGSMLLSVRATGQPVAGVLWYQGESDADPAAAALYRDRMRKLVAASRRDLRQPRLPWVVVQIGRVFGHRPAETIPAWNRIQEEQRRLPAAIAHLETVPAVDLPLDDPIHIGAAGQPRLALRLARAADRLVHGNRKEAPMPRLKAIGKPQHDKKTAGIVLDVHFENVVGGLRSHGEPDGFALVDAEGKKIDEIFRVSLDGATARLRLQKTPLSGTRLSYGHGVTPNCTIADARDCALPVFGPLHFMKPSADLPFVVRWRKSGILPISKPLGKITPPDMAKLKTTVQDYGASWLPGFINEHAVWDGNKGHAHFAARIDLPEAMRLEALLGYDGPFRLWIDGKPSFTDLKGTNPCVADESKKIVRLAKGRHTLHVAMDLNDGRAWGFFVRFRRIDLPPARILSGDYARPVYSV
ncbi:sialate O-acetylesterase [Verrucomicrobium sp. GAS474]|uniref:sialate O-acetylesterase n=1 Tax=Verrucomicrobium sp. GAS474 TaxID=1882831 RepID=UPI00087D7190|nr:sialate O-acetylesterase [Verrucomicrobium sp. GAS474]SDT95757.1 sialate O-acetylesterase [Verrucomicrobium sp. GAS474]